MFSFSFEELTLIGLFFAILEITGMIVAVHAILNARTSQGAIAWALSLITAPYLALPLYAFFGQPSSMVMSNPSGVKMCRFSRQR